jgi:hypothetical protein
VRALLGSAATLRRTFGDESGVPSDPGGAITVAVTDGAGATVSGSPFAATLEANSMATYVATLPARTQADTFALSWLRNGTEIATDVLDLVGSRLVPLERLREDPELRTKSRDTLLRVAEEVEDEVAAILGWSPFLRGGRLSFVSDGKLSRLGPLPAYASLVYSALSPASVATTATINRGGYLTIVDASSGLLTPFALGTWTVWLLHGRRAPADLVRAATVLARYRGRSSPSADPSTTGFIPERASVLNTASGTITFLTPDDAHPTGLHEVDAVLRRLREPVGA